MTFDWKMALSIIDKAATVAAFLGVPYAADVAAAAEIAPEVIADAQDAIERIQALFGKGPQGDAVTKTVAMLETKHIDAIETVHRQWTSYQKLGHNPVSPVPGQV